MSSPEDLTNASLLDLFRIEVETQAAAMTSALLGLERDPAATHHCEELMRGAHSLKGAARIVNRRSAVGLAHAMEECFVNARPEGVGLSQKVIDEFLRGIDLLRQIARVPEPELSRWETEHREEIDRLRHSFGPSMADSAMAAASDGQQSARAIAPEQTEVITAQSVTSVPQPAGTRSPGKGPEARAMRVTASNLDRLLGLAGESLVASRWLDGFASEMLRLKRQQHEIETLLSSLRESVTSTSLSERFRGLLS